MNTLIDRLIRLRNAVDYPLRQILRWQRGGYRPPTGPKEDLFSHLSPEDRKRAEETALRLAESYHLEGFARVSGPVNYRENLFYLHLLETALEQAQLQLPASLLAADIGPSHWFYVQALHACLRFWQCPEGREVRLEGYEADAFRVYTDLRSRLDHAQGHMRGLPGVTYLPRAFEAQPERFDLVVMFFPFVFERDHLEWGLPGRMFVPRALLAAAWESLRPGGALLVANQGEEEHRVERENFTALGIPVDAALRIDPLLYTYDLERFVLVGKKAI